LSRLFRGGKDLGWAPGVIDYGSVRREFNKYGLIECSETDEPDKDMKDKPPISFVFIKCRKGT